MAEKRQNITQNGFGSARRGAGRPRGPIPLALAVLVAVLSWGAAAAQDFKVRAEVNAAKVGQNDPVILQVIAEGPGAMNAVLAERPASADFRLVQNPSVSTQISMVNGQTSAQKIFTLVFNATRTGRLKLPAVRVQAGGQMQQSRPVDIEVAPGSIAPPQSRPQRQRDPFDAFLEDRFDQGRGAEPAMAADDLLLRLETSRNQAWVGQPLTVTLTLLYRVSIQKADLEKDGKMEGFWVENVDLGNQGQNPPSRRQLDGKVYNAQPLRQWVLFPTRAGRLRLEPWSLKLVAILPSRSFFSFGQPQQVVRQSNALEIAVNDFPAGGRPDGFTGLCGRFQMTAGLDKTHVRAGEGINLKVKISGEGNFRSVPEIKLPEIPGCKVYTPKTQDDVKLENGALRGSRTWEFILVPLEKGSFQVPPLDIPYFDPEAGAYRRLTASAMAIMAEEGAGEILAAGPAGVAALPVELKGKDIRYIHGGPALERAAPGLIYRQTWFLAAFLVLGLGTLAWVLSQETRRRRRNDAANWARSRAAVQARKALRRCAVTGRPGFSDAFFQSLYKVLQDYLENRFALSRIDLTAVRINQALAGVGIPETDAAEMVRCLQLCESYRYAPTAVAESSPPEILEQVRSLLARLEGGAK